MKYLLIPTLCLFFLTNVHGQGMPGGGSGESLDDSTNFKFVPIPYISYDRSLGGTFGAIPMAMYRLNKKDTISPASISGLFGMYTTNETWFAMFFQQLYFNEDNWRVTAAGGLGSINFQFFLEAPVNSVVKYNTQADFIYLMVQRRIYKQLYGGLHYQWMNFRTTFGEFPRSTNNDLHGVGVILSFDKRDDVYYPHKGYLSDADVTSFINSTNTKTNTKLELDHNMYFPHRGNMDIIAWRFFGGFGIGDLTFEQQFVVGQDDIRGYTQGKYRGEQHVALQGEYRWNFHTKMSAVGFAGVATVYGSLNEDHNGLLLPGIGAGFRYNVVPEYHMNVGLDIAAGRDDWGIYFRIGEAF